MAKLTVDLIPIQSWKLSLANLMPKNEWKKIREACYQKANWRCEICNNVGIRHRVECHEIWEFMNNDYTQRLVGFIALCPDCHAVKHIGRAFSLGDASKNKAISHLMKINEWTELETKKHIEDAVELWIERSFIKWDIDTSLVGFNFEKNENPPEFLITWYGDVPDDKIIWKLFQDTFYLTSKAISIWKRRTNEEQEEERKKPKIKFKDLFY